MTATGQVSPLLDTLCWLVRDNPRTKKSRLRDFTISVMCVTATAKGLEPVTVSSDKVLYNIATDIQSILFHDERVKTIAQTLIPMAIKITDETPEEDVMSLLLTIFNLLYDELSSHLEEVRHFCLCSLQSVRSRLLDNYRDLSSLFKKVNQLPMSVSIDECVTSLSKEDMLSAITPLKKKKGEMLAALINRLSPKNTRISKSFFESFSIPNFLVCIFFLKNLFLLIGERVVKGEADSLIDMDEVHRILTHQNQ